MLDAIGVVVKDMDESIRFYNLFGMKFQSFGEDKQHYESHTQSGVRLMLDTLDLMKQLNPDYQEIQGSGVIMAFKKESAVEVNELFASVIDAGFHPIKEPFDAFWGQRYASVKDPDGNQIDIFAVL